MFLKSSMGKHVPFSFPGKLSYYNLNIYSRYNLLARLDPNRNHNPSVSSVSDHLL